MNKKRLIIFILCAIIPMLGIGLVMHFIAKETFNITLSAAAMFIPLLSVVITQLIFREPVLKGLGVSFKVNSCWIVGWLLMPVIALATLGVTLMMSGAVWNTDNEMLQMVLKSMPDGFGVWEIVAISIIGGLFTGTTVNALFAFGEEVAWRGFLLKLFRGKRFLTVAFWVGLIWGFWHTPFVLNGHNFPQHPVVGVFMMILFCMLFTPMLIYFRVKSGSVFVPAIMHGTYNAVAGISFIIVSPSSDLLYGSCGFASMIVLLLVDICIYLYDKCISKENIFTSII
ncbi:MAG: CPBP family intramembrane metalloprotease [Muribaculaceae bacterium]|nr:CPBP family intramembrane metalloprotease [Muribaculaceae bacterium]